MRGMCIRPLIAGIALLLAASLVGCEALLPADDPLLPIPTRDVVLAVEAIEAGTLIEPQMISRRTVPLDPTNSMALTQPSDVVGKRAVIDILELQLITPNLLAEE
jgi:flagella basal body P-ring formation protein FlgA